MPQFDFTPKAFANFSPGLERSDNPGDQTTNHVPTLQGFQLRGALSGLYETDDPIPGLSLALQPWAEISERLRRKFKLMHYLNSWPLAQRAKLIYNPTQYFFSDP